MLEKDGISHAFGVPGAASNPLYAALRPRTCIDHTLACHFEGAAHMSEGYTHAAPAMAVIRDVTSDNLFLPYEFYHQSRTDGELAAIFLSFKDPIADVEIADNPGLHEPGSGVLDSGDYGGWVGCEGKPQAVTGAGLDRAAQYVAAEKQNSGKRSK